MDSSHAASHVVQPSVTPFKYSNRVILKSILECDYDHKAALVGQSFIVGGWVKTAKEVKKEHVAPPQLPQTQPQPQPKVKAKGPKDVSCAEMLQSKIPFFRTIVRVLGGNNYPLREKLEAIVQRPPSPQTSAAYLQINDGSCPSVLQVVIECSLAPPSVVMPTGTCILVEGTLRKPSAEGKHFVELKAEKILNIGTVEQDKYPLSKKRLPLDSLRDCLHFRPRTTTVASVIRIRSALTFAAQTFFQKQEFINVHLPIITTTDPEGFSERFQVTTLFNQLTKHDEIEEGVNLDTVRAAIKEKSNLVEQLKRTDSNREALNAALQDLKKTDALASHLEARDKSKQGYISKSEKVSFGDDFFSCQSFLTVSGRLHLESYAAALGNVYSFGPRFQANKGQSAKHVAEMWMVETSMAFAGFEDAMNCASDLIKFLCNWVLENCPEDMKFVSKRVDKTIIDHLQSVISSSFEKTTYREAVDSLKKATGQAFQMKPEWGVALTEEHKSYLADQVYKKPVIIYNYPKELQPFYVRLNDDGITTAAFDIIAPKVGTVVRGSQNEERLGNINKRIKELGLTAEQYDWYLDLRRHGTTKNSGFSLGFDSLVLFATGLNNVRDCIPFPRTFGKLNN